MAKRVQVVLTKDVSKLGKLGDVVDVAPGYARNFLFPQSFATTITPGIMKQVARRKELELQRLAALKAIAIEQKTALEAVGALSIAKPVGENEDISQIPVIWMWWRGLLDMLKSRRWSSIRN